MTGKKSTKESTMVPTSSIPALSFTPVAACITSSVVPNSVYVTWVRVRVWVWVWVRARANSVYVTWVRVRLRLRLRARIRVRVRARATNLALGLRLRLRLGLESCCFGVEPSAGALYVRVRCPPRRMTS